MADEQTAETLANDTTNDAPVNDAPVNDGVVDLDAPVEVKDEAAEGEKADTDGAGEKDAGEDGRPAKLSGAQRSKIREQRLRDELSAREREIEELRRSAPAAAGETDEKPPREEDFNGDYFAYQTAKTAYEAGKAAGAAIDKRLAAREKSERDQKQAEVVRERNIAHAERVEDAREVIADFDSVMKEMEGVQIRNDVIDEIKSSDKSALLAYHLAKNPDKLQALNAMSGRELAREMGRLEGSIRMPAAKKQTTAPTPLSRITGGAAPSFDPAKASMDDYVAKRKSGWNG